jgi:cyclopropane fatty-acyl-phospholipid synthase-like methyltransferase
MHRAEQSKNCAWNTDDCAQHSSPQYAWVKELIPKLKLTGKEAPLNIGCGDGKVAATLVKCFPPNLEACSSKKIVCTYLERHPLDEVSGAYVRMVRLEVDASKPA